MKAVIITLALAGLASTAPVGAQILGTRLPTPTTNTNVGINGSWQVVGRDNSGNTIYERRTQDRNGNIVVQRARRDSRGNMSIISTNTIGNNSSGNNCAYNQSTNTVGDIIFGRSNTNVNCNDVGNRVDGGWYQVGQGRNNNSIYERRTTDRNGNLVIQRARRNSNGSFTILSTRAYNGNSDKQWQKAQQQRQKEMRKQQREQDKQYNKSQRDDNQDNRSVVGRSDDRSYVANDAAAKGNGHGKDKDNGKGKDKDKHKSDN